MTKLIPFSRELYEKGYKAIKRNGQYVEGVFFEEAAKRICYLSKGDDGTHTVYWSDENGCIHTSLRPSSHDLLLEAKTIDLWIGINRLSETDEDYGKYLMTTHAIFDKSQISKTNESIIKITVDAETLEQV